MMKPLKVKYSVPAAKWCGLPQKTRHSAPASPCHWWHLVDIRENHSRTIKKDYTGMTFRFLQFILVTHYTCLGQAWHNWGWWEMEEMWVFDQRNVTFLILISVTGPNTYRWAHQQIEHCSVGSGKCSGGQ